MISSRLRNRICVFANNWRFAGCARTVLIAMFCAVLLGGCRFGNQTKTVAMRPAKHSVRSGQLLVLSDFQLPKDDPVIKDLVKLRKQVTVELELPLQEREVVVYIFTNRDEYKKYLSVAHPKLPDRRAYFIGTRHELAVYTYWGDRIQEDLRHEYTHGLLHSRIPHVPLWIDEGLAEYFEVVGPRSGSINTKYASRLGAALSNGWQPDLERLEKLKQFARMSQDDYQESWAWVHFMMHHNAETRAVLIAYLRDLRTQNNPEPLSQRLKNVLADPTQRFKLYVVSLQMMRTLSNSSSRQPRREHHR